MRSVLVSVSDLARSVPFYCDVLGLHEVAREGEVAVLESDRGNFAIVLREAAGQGVHAGQEALGPRAVSFDVGSATELEGVVKRLEAAKAFVSRSLLHEAEPVEVVTGRDPDRLPLLFTFYAAGPLLADHYRDIALHMYGVDL